MQRCHLGSDPRGLCTAAHADPAPHRLSTSDHHARRGQPHPGRRPTDRRHRHPAACACSDAGAFARPIRCLRSPVASDRTHALRTLPGQPTTLLLRNDDRVALNGSAMQDTGMSRADAESILNESVSSFTTDNEMRDAECGLDPSVFRAAIIGAAEGQARPRVFRDFNAGTLIGEYSEYPAAILHRCAGPCGRFTHKNSPPSMLRLRWGCRSGRCLSTCGWAGTLCV